MTKLTLSIDEQVVATAKRLARRQGTSVSAMFTNVIQTMARREDQSPSPVPPSSVVARLTGCLDVPEGKSDRELLAEALLERHGDAQ